MAAKLAKSLTSSQRLKLPKKQFTSTACIAKTAKTAFSESLIQLMVLLARVNLKKKLAVVEMSREISDEELTEAVKNAGYEVEKIERKD